MSTVNMLQAKTQLSKLVEAVESGAEEEIIIARNGKPAARLVPIAEMPKKKKRQLGLAEGKFPAFTWEEWKQSDADMVKIFEEAEEYERQSLKDFEERQAKKNDASSS